MKVHFETAFESVIENHFLDHGDIAIAPDGFDRERAIFPAVVLDFIRETHPKEWAKLEVLHAGKTGDQILGDLCTWLDAHGCLATLRRGFKCYGDERATWATQNSTTRCLPVEEIYAALFEDAGFRNAGWKAIRKRNSKKELFEFVVHAVAP